MNQCTNTPFPIAPVGCDNRYADINRRSMDLKINLNQTKRLLKNGFVDIIRKGEKIRVCATDEIREEIRKILAW